MNQEQCTFGPEYEKRLCAALLRDPNFFHAWFEWFDRKYIRSEIIGTILEVLGEFKQTHTRAPDHTELTVIIKEHLVSKIATEERATQEWNYYKTELEDLFKYPAPTLEFVKENALKYTQQRALECAALEMVKLIGTGHEGLMLDLVQKALSVGVNITSFGLDYFGEIRKRALQRLSTPRETNRIPFFIPKFDDLIGGIGFRENGSGIPELLMFGGGQNVGKSRCIVHEVKVATSLGYNGIVFSAEMAEDLYAERLDMSISNLTTPELYDIANLEIFQEKVQMVGNQGGKLFIKKFPAGSVTIRETVSIANRIQSTLGIKLHFIAWDYTSEFKSEGEYEQNRFKEAEIVRSQKKACDELGCAGIGAFQLNREGMRQEMADLTHASEDITVCKVADIIIVLGQTEEEYLAEPSIMRWCARKVRAAERNQTVLLLDDRKRMRFLQHPDETVNTQGAQHEH